MNFPFKIIAHSEEATKSIASRFSRVIKTGDVVALNGNLGSGKTFFVKSVCENYNITGVQSPTFAIVNEYSGDKKIYHFDFYRLKNTEELLDIGFEDYINDTETIIFIEWADKFNNVLPMDRYEINFNFVNERSREIEIKKLLSK
ncbi:tRNA threonylcarbamoyladenosine biosynthesis protein TsaE [bacterium BMS3Abin04]|nr:tRNA threonylcarbamoyladenosine biosynthesis protein TsaE [bacterium BMS3Abin04]